MLNGLEKHLRVRQKPLVLNIRQCQLADSAPAIDTLMLDGI